MQPISEERRKVLEKQGYRIVGNHSAIKVCEWCKKDIRAEGVCYKNTFYGIDSKKCIQMTPALHVCTHRCQWCWRDIDFTNNKWTGPVDDPKDIVEGCIKAHLKYNKGFGGNKEAKNYEEAKIPKHFAISLSGEPTFYPKLPELIDKIKEKDMTAFLVSNGTNPEMIKQLRKHEPTQLYITLSAPNKKIYDDVCQPLVKDGWNKMIESISILKDFRCNTVLRLTLTKELNMSDPEEYAKIIKESGVKYVECKAYMWVGYSRQRLTIDNMPLHEEILEFAKEIAEYSGYKIIDKKKESRVVLLERS